jgi:hypothetical protein
MWKKTAAKAPPVDRLYQMAFCPQFVCRAAELPNGHEIGERRGSLIEGHRHYLAGEGQVTAAKGEFRLVPGLLLVPGMAVIGRAAERGNMRSGERPGSPILTESKNQKIFKNESWF